MITHSLRAYPNFWKHEEVNGLSVKRGVGVGVGAYLFSFKEYCFSVDTNPNPETAFFKKRKTPTPHFTDT